VKRSLLSRHNALSSPNERSEWRGGVGGGWGFRELRSLGECGAAPHPRPRAAAARREGSAPPLRPSKHLEIFALFPVRHLRLEALDFGVLDVDVIIDKARAQRVAEERIVFQRIQGFAQRLRQ